MANEEQYQAGLARAQNQVGSTAAQITSQVTKVAKSKLKWWVIGSLLGFLFSFWGFIFLVVIIVVIVISGDAEAVVDAPGVADYCKFGRFEVLPFGPCIDNVVKGSDGGFVGAISFVIKMVLGAAVGLGLIMVVVGGYVYMTAGGNAQRVGTAKTMISAALLGIILAIAASLILNTISPQFSSDIRLPF